MINQPTTAEVIIIGGGIVGCSIAYHLTKLGIKDVLILEQNKLTSGTTWHAAGLVGQLRATQNLTRLAKYTTELFTTLEAETGQLTGYTQTGSLSLALNKSRMTELARQASTANAFGVEAHHLSTSEVLSHWPDLNVEDLVGAIFLPGDGQTNPVDTTMALARGAQNGGAVILENCHVESLLTRQQQITGVRTANGEIHARQVVLAAGMWSRQLAAGIGVSVPLQAAEHFYIVTEAMNGLSRGMPTLRIPDEYAYYKEDAGKLLLGAFEPRAKPWSLDGVDKDFSFGTLPEDIDHFMPILEMAMKRYPALESAGIQLFFNGPESFTPDDKYLLGPTTQYSNLFVAAGFNSIGIQSSGGAGKVLADWMVNGHPPMDLFDVDIKRTFPFQSNRKYLKDRTKETLGLLYAMHWPYRQFDTARGARRSPFHQSMLDQGAAMGELSGWERPNWFARGPMKPEYEYSYDRQNWFESCRLECLAVRDSVALFDQTSYPIYTLKGDDALKVLNYISANNIDIEINQIVYTQWLNERGGIEADITITRTGETDYMIVSSCASEIRDFNWLQQHIPKGAHAFAENIGSGIAMIGLMGPKSRDLLASITPSDISNSMFPFYSSKEIEIGYAKVRANRLTYVGELGFEIYIPVEFAQHVYEQIVAAGAQFDLTHAGYHALNACRIEKSYKHFGHDISDEVTPLTAGLGFAIKMDSDDFIGKQALLEVQRPLSQRLVNIALDLPDVNPTDVPLLIHDEPIFMDDELVGLTTSGSWGYRVNKSLGIAMLNHSDGITKSFLSDNSFQIEVAGKRYPITVQLSPFYDPKSLNVKQ